MILGRPFASSPYVVMYPNRNSLPSPRAIVAPPFTFSCARMPVPCLLTLMVIDKFPPCSCLIPVPKRAAQTNGAFPSRFSARPDAPNNTAERHVPMLCGRGGEACRMPLDAAATNVLHRLGGQSRALLLPLLPLPPLLPLLQPLLRSWRSQPASQPAGRAGGGQLTRVAGFAQKIYSKLVARVGPTDDEAERSGLDTGTRRSF